MKYKLIFSFDWTIELHISLLIINLFFGICREDTEAKAQQLRIWRIINLIRAIGAVLGWLVLSFAPTTDFTSGKVEWNHFNMVEKIEIY